MDIAGASMSSVLLLFADAKHRHVPVGLGDHVGDPEPRRRHVVEPLDAEDDPPDPARCAVIDPTEEIFVELKALGALRRS